MLKVMIVEDELLARTGLRMLVEWEKNGFQLVAEATDGQEALEFLVQNQVDILITDIRMPVMDGLELMSEIRTRRIHCEIIVLSGFDDFAFVKQALVMGARDYIHKPTMTPEDIIATLKRVAGEIENRSAFQGGGTMPQDISERKKQLQDCLYCWSDDRVPQKNYSELENIRFVAGVMRVFYNETEEGCREKLLKLEAHLCDLWEQTLSRVPKELEAYWHSGDCFIFVRETPFEEDEVAMLHTVVARLSAGELLWADTKYRSPFANMPEIIKILKERVNNSNEQEKEFSEVGPYVRQVLAIIKENFSLNLSLESIAESIHVNPSYLSRIFQKETGFTFGAYLTDCRMKEAKHLLRNSNMTIQQIGEAIGYNNSKYFMNLFKKRVGVTPGNYRLNNKSNPNEQNSAPKHLEK